MVVNIPGVDYSFSKPNPQQLAALGYKFAALYIGAGTEDKQLHPAERDALWAAGLDIVLLCEAYANSALQGYAEGARQAKLCLSDFIELGVPNDIPVYFAADTDLVAAGDFQTIGEFCHGAADILGANRVGMYGEYDCMVWLSQHTPQWCKWFFQTYAWSHQLWFSGNHFEQYQNNVNLAGGNVDLCRAKTTQYGQWSKNPQPKPVENEMKQLWYTKLPDGSIARDDGTFYVVVGKSEQDRAWLDDVYIHGGRAGESSSMACDGPWKMDIRNPGLHMNAEPYLTLLNGTTSVPALQSSGTTPTPTPPGNYTITLTGTAIPND